MCGSPPRGCGAGKAVSASGWSVRRPAGAMDGLNPRRMARIEAAVNETVGDLIEDIQADMDRQHAAIDTPASYEAVQQQCDRW